VGAVTISKTTDRPAAACGAAWTRWPPSVKAVRVRVAIDGRRLQDRPLGGVGRSVRLVLPHLASGAEVVVLTDARRAPPELPGFGGEIASLSVPRRWHEAPWLHVAVARWLRGFDGVFHGTFNQVPLVSGCPAVVTVHDLSFEHHPEDFGTADRRWFQLQARVAVHRARRVLTPTDAVRRELLATYGLDGARVVVVPNPVDPVFRPGGDRPPGLPDRYVVAVGGAPRRGLGVAVAAWRASGAAGDGVGLVVVGREVPPAVPGVVGLGAVADDVWAGLLAGAEALCYPTRLEGFGLPALEAAACGTPVVCAPLPALKEVLGDAAEWCAGTDVVSVAAGLRRVLGEPGRHAELVGMGLARAAAAPGPAQVGALTLDAYRSAR
jgi:glycosyltransferase involved in cell wall biosynthesis